MGKLRLSAFGSRSFQVLLAAALFKRFSLLTLSNFAEGFAACFNSSLLPPNS